MTTARSHSHRLPRVAAAAVIAAALAAPPALAQPIDSPAVPFRPDPGPGIATDADVAPARPPVVQKIDDGFDWGSAAIGAGGAGSLIVVVALGGVAYSVRRRVGVARWSVH
jgi:hypothetical protein